METTTPSKKPFSRSGEKSGTQTVFWWIAWISLAIASFFVAAAIWTPLIASRFGSIRESKNAVLWVTAVFGTWMIILIPLIVMMYQKTDKAYEDARVRREKAANGFRSASVDKSKRIIPKELSQKLESIPETINGGHLVTITLKNGQKIPFVFIANRKEILGLYDASEMSFEGSDAADLEVDPLSRPPVFFTPKWLRLDGVQAPD